MTKFYYYVTGNTAEGFVNLLETNIEEIEQVFVLKHTSNKFKTKIINNIIKNHEADYDIEILCSALGNEYLDGIIIRQQSVAVLIDTIVLTDYKGIIEIDLEHTGKSVLDESQANFNKFTQTAYENFATGLRIHDDLEAIYINEMNFTRADEYAKEYISNLIYSVPKQKGEGKVYHRLFGTNTSDGVVNVIPHIIENLSNVHFIKGRAGTGKSTFMKKLVKACTEHGLDVELYHCSFDPNSIDMVLVRELDYCIFDSTDPHEFFPKRDGDVVIDLYEELVTPGTDEKFASNIDELNNRYKSYMKQGIVNLKNAGLYLDKIEQNYGSSVIDSELDKAMVYISGIIQ